MKITFIMPSVGRKKNEPYVKTWQMEPLALAVLSALTPPDIEKRFFDDRIEPIDPDDTPDIAAINIETYTARRAYQIANDYRNKGVTVILGGFHATLCPDECSEHADTVVTGNAEPVWEKIIHDFRNGSLKKHYNGNLCFSPVLPDRSIYADKNYTPLVLLEGGRGCRFSCEFCSICAFFKHKYIPRAIAEIKREIETTVGKLYFFIDDNLAADKKHFLEILEMLSTTKIRWVGQLSIDVAREPAVLDLMKQSGCIGVLIGFESLNAANLGQMNKKVNKQALEYAEAVAALRKRSIAIYATFLFGYDADTEDTFKQTLQFSLEQKFFFTAFNHLVPFPGTPLYERLKAEGRLTDNTWWLNASYRFGDLAFFPKNFSPDELSEMCLKYRKKFYSITSIIKRGLDFRANTSDLLKFGIFWSQAFIGRGDIDRRQGLPLGLVEDS